MSNVGLKPYAKYIEINYSSFWKAYINVNKDDANLIMVFNLVDIQGPTPINISAIYNYNKKDEARCFGKGIFLNLFKSFNCAGTSM